MKTESCNKLEKAFVEHFEKHTNCNIILTYNQAKMIQSRYYFDSVDMKTTYISGRR